MLETVFLGKYKLKRTDGETYKPALGSYICLTILVNNAQASPLAIGKAMPFKRKRAR